MDLQTFRDSLTNSDTMKMSLVETSGNVVEQDSLVDCLLTITYLYWNVHLYHAGPNFCDSLLNLC